jgi:hypothetical protein
MLCRGVLDHDTCGELQAIIFIGKALEARIAADAK